MNDEKKKYFVWDSETGTLIIKKMTTKRLKKNINEGMLYGEIEKVDISDMDLSELVELNRYGVVLT